MAYLALYVINHTDLNDSKLRWIDRGGIMIEVGPSGLERLNIYIMCTYKCVPAW